MCHFLEENFLNDCQTSIVDYFYCPVVSLEESTKPLRELIHGIEDFVKIAKENCFESSEGLSYDESAAIYLYTMEIERKRFSCIVNMILENPNQQTQLKLCLYLKLLSNGVGKLPTFIGDVWKAITRDDVTKKLGSIHEISSSHYLSSTKSLETLLQVLPRNNEISTVFRIETRNGRNISKYAKFIEQEEVLLLPGLRFSFNTFFMLNNNMKVYNFREVTQQKSREIFKRKSSLHRSPSTTSLSITTSGNQKLSCSIFTETFHEINCPRCEQSIEFDAASYQNCSLMECFHCNEKFRRFDCHRCQRSTFFYGLRKYVSGNFISCRDCQQSYRIIDCPHCSSCQTFERENCRACVPHRCLVCSKFYQIVDCPHCEKVTVWPDNNLRQGLRMLCNFCRNTFQLVLCPVCTEIKFWKETNRTPGYPEICRKCQTIFQHINCIFCQEPQVWINGSYRERQRIDCPKCQNSYQHSYCPKCLRANYFKNCDLRDEHRIVCSHCQTEY